MQHIRPIPESYWVVPEQILAGEYPATAYSPERARQRLISLLKNGFNSFVDLTHPDEIASYEPLLMQEAAEFGLPAHYRRFPIGDYGLPSPEQMRAILAYLEQARQQGCKTYLHCQGGIGRTGTVVGCYLVQQGLNGEAALARLAEWWRGVPKSALHPHSPETREQVEFIRNWPTPGV